MRVVSLNIIVFVSREKVIKQLKILLESFKLCIIWRAIAPLVGPVILAGLSYSREQAVTPLVEMFSVRSSSLWVMRAQGT